MKRRKIGKLGMAFCLLFGALLFLADGMKARAAEIIATVEGTVSAETTSDLLYLSTSGGKMQIKLDAGTDASGCKILLPDTRVTVSVSHGGDGYLHAVRLSSDTAAAAVTVDSSSSVVVTGTIDPKTRGDLLYFNTAQGQMQIKLDATTDMSGCTVLVAGTTYSITCARGSDAYLHAVSISEGGKAAVSAGAVSGLTPAPADPANVSAATMAVMGTVSEKTTESMLYLSTSGGEMQFVIDSNSDTRNGMVLTPGRQLVVAFCRGSDAYLHVVSTTGVKGVSSVTVDTSGAVTVTGTVGEKSDENLLYLDAQGGTMELKLDNLRSVSNCKVLVKGKKLAVSCVRGSDAYMHAVAIAGN